MITDIILTIWGASAFVRDPVTHSFVCKLICLTAWLLSSKLKGGIFKLAAKSKRLRSKRVQTSLAVFVIM